MEKKIIKSIIIKYYKIIKIKIFIKYFNYINISNIYFYIYLFFISKKKKIDIN